tara:strand:- start:38 stop:1297 length:1260 start_codon:yes stop_codon:yes gene_type:complete
MLSGKPRIWIVNQYANTADMPGGTRHYEIASYLVKQGLDIELFSSDFNLSRREFLRLDGFKIHKKEKINGINWHWLKVIPYQKNNWKRYLNQASFCLHFFLRQYLKMIFDIFKNKTPDLIIASSPQLILSFFALLISKAFRKPFIFEVRDLWPQVLIDLGGMDPNSVFIKFLKKIECFLYKKSNYVVVLSKGSIEYVKNRGAKNVIWLPNGPDLKKFKSTSNLNYFEPYEKELTFKCIYAGSHGVANDLENVIDTAKLLVDKPIKFIFIGDGTEKKKLIKKAFGLKNIEFIPSVSKELMPMKLASADVILISLKDIGLFKYGISPNKLYDAYALSIPVICTIKGSIKNEIEINKLGYAADPGKPRELAKAIMKMYELPIKERRKMGKRAREIAEKIYSREKVCKYYETLIKKIISYESR